MARRQPFATQAPLAQGQLILARGPPDPRVARLRREERRACHLKKIAADDPAVGGGTMLIRQAYLEERALRGACRALVSQVNFKRSHSDIRGEPDHHRDRRRDHRELTSGLIQRACAAANLNDQAPRYRVPVAGCGQPG